MATRRVGVVRTALAMQTIGLAAYVLVLLALARWPGVSWDQLPFALALAVLGIVGLSALYKAFALGPIAVVSPIVASYAALTVILIVIFLGERLTTGQALAIAVTFVGVVVASTDVRTLRRSVEGVERFPLGVRLGLGATLIFAVWGVVFAAATRSSDALSIVVALRICSIALLVPVALWLRASPAPVVQPRALALVAIVGVLDTSANVLMALGFEAGYASFVLTGSGAYPIIPAVLAILVLRERLAPNQYLGVAILIAGLIALGLQS